MIASEFFGYGVFVIFVFVLAILVRHRRAALRWLINDRKEIKDRKKWARRDVEDAQDELEAIEAEEKEAEAKEAQA